MCLAWKSSWRTVSLQWVGGRTREIPGYDLRGIIIGSEGTLAIVTKVIVRLLRQPEAVKTLLAVFRELDQASAAVSGIIAAGIVPAAIEMMDDLCIQAVEPAVNAGYPADAGAVLLVEVEGLTESVEEEVEEIENVCNEFSPIEIRTANRPRSARPPLGRTQGRAWRAGTACAQLPAS